MTLTPSAQEQETTILNSLQWSLSHHISQYIYYRKDINHKGYGMSTPLVSIFERVTVLFDFVNYSMKCCI